MTQLLDRLESRLRVEQDEFAAAELLAKKAAYLGRIGRTEEAKEVIQLLRGRFNDGRSGRVTCFLQIAEGVLLHNSFQSMAALDKLSRADLLAQAMRQPDLIGICAAWKGFIEFDLSRFESMNRSYLLIKDLGLEDDHAVQSRVAATLMTAAILVGEQDVAREWFRNGHRHAVAEGDLACIDALLFNRAVFGTARQRVAWCSDEFDTEWATTLRAELESARNLQNLVGITTMQDHIDLCVARLDLMEARFVEAESRLSRLQNLDRFAGKHVNSVALALELIYAKSCANDGQDVLGELQSLALEDLASLDPDERLVALTIYAKLVDQHRSADRHEAGIRALTECRAAYRAYELELRAALSPWLTTKGA